MREAPIDPLAVQLVDDVLYANPAQSHARTDRVDALLSGRDGHLTPEPRLPRDRLDFDHATVNLRDFKLEKTSQQVLMRP